MDEKPQVVASIDGVTSTAKWLVGAAGALGAASVAGLQFSGLGEASNAGWAIAAFGAVFVAIALVLLYAARVLLPAFDSLADLDGRQALLREQAAARTNWPVPNPSEMAMFAMLDPLFAHLFNVTAKSPDQLLFEARSADSATAAATTRLREVLLTCNAFEARRRYSDMLRVLAGAAVVVLVAVPVFALAITKKPDRTPDIDKATPIVVTFAQLPTELTGTGCAAGSPFKGMAVGGDFEQPIVRLPAQNGCRGAKIELAIDDSYALAA